MGKRRCQPLGPRETNCDPGSKGKEMPPQDNQVLNPLSSEDSLHSPCLTPDSLCPSNITCLNLSLTTKVPYSVHLTSSFSMPLLSPWSWAPYLHPAWKSDSSSYFFLFLNSFALSSWRWIVYPTLRRVIAVREWSESFLILDYKSHGPDSKSHKKIMGKDRIGWKRESYQSVEIN